MAGRILRNQGYFHLICISLNCIVTGWLNLDPTVDLLSLLSGQFVTGQFVPGQFVPGQFVAWTIRLRTIRPRTIRRLDNSFPIVN